MAALRQHSGRLAACHAAARDKHAFFTRHRLVSRHTLSGRLGVYRTVDHGVGLDSSHAALLTGDTGANLTNVVRTQLLYVIRVCQKRPSQGNHVTGTVLYTAFSHLRRIHAARHEDRNLYDLFD